MIICPDSRMGSDQLDRAGRRREAPAIAPGRIVRLHADVIDEDLAVASIAVQRAAQRPELGWRLDPAGLLRVELAERLQFAVLRLGEERDAHRVGHLDGAVRGGVLLAGLARLGVVAGAAAAGGAFGGGLQSTMVRGIGGLAAADEIGLAAAGFHHVYGLEGVRAGFVAGLQGVPGNLGRRCGCCSKRAFSARRTNSRSMMIIESVIRLQQICQCR